MLRWRQIILIYLYDIALRDAFIQTSIPCLLYTHSWHTALSTFSILCTPNQNRSHNLLLLKKEKIKLGDCDNAVSTRSRHHPGAQRAVRLRNRIQLNWYNQRLVSRYPLNGDQFYVNNNYFKRPTWHRHIRTSTRIILFVLYYTEVGGFQKKKISTYFSHHSTSGYQSTTDWPKNFTILSLW